MASNNESSQKKETPEEAILEKKRPGRKTPVKKTPGKKTKSKLNTKTHNWLIAIFSIVGAFVIFLLSLINPKIEGSSKLPIYTVKIEQDIVSGDFHFLFTIGSQFTNNSIIPGFIGTAITYPITLTTIKDINITNIDKKWIYLHHGKVIFTTCLITLKWDEIEKMKTSKIAPIQFGLHYLDNRGALVLNEKGEAFRQQVEMGVESILKQQNSKPGPPTLKNLSEN